MIKKAGILMAISSLPSKYGIGDFGSKTYEFVDELHNNHIKIWQILPFNRLNYGNSPYQPLSSIAGDEIFISPDLLLEDKLLYQKDIVIDLFDSIKVEYSRVRLYKENLFKIAFQNFNKSSTIKTEFNIFLSNNLWVHNYAIFIAFKKAHHLQEWLQWPKEYKNWIKQPNLTIEMHAEEILYQKFLQFIFFKQWNQLKNYANKKNITIMGDIPFYVGIDSVDVWENQDLFLLNQEGLPTFVAGVPPDYFSSTGQRWGNPLYNWEKIKRNEYKFWIERLSNNMNIFDIIRIDHFRAFDTYWKIPATCSTAMEGEWIEGPSYDFFNFLYRTLPNIHLVAEDLGDMRPEVYRLRDHFHLSGMKIIQFTFDPKEHNNNFKDYENMIIYTGTHDNQTILGWFQSQDSQTQTRTYSYLTDHGYLGDLTERWIRFALDSIAKWSIIPMQDLLGLDDSARFNTPGTIGDPNWQWRMPESISWKKALKDYGLLIIEYNRN